MLQNRHAAAIKEQKEVCTRDIERARVVPALIYASAVYICASPARTAALTRLGYKRSISRKLQSDCYGLRGIWRDAARREEKAEEKREREAKGARSRAILKRFRRWERDVDITRERERELPFSLWEKHLRSVLAACIYTRRCIFRETGLC